MLPQTMAAYYLQSNALKAGKVAALRRRKLASSWWKLKQWQDEERAWKEFILIYYWLSKFWKSVSLYRTIALGNWSMYQPSQLALRPQ